MTHMHIFYNFLNNFVFYFLSPCNRVFRSRKYMFVPVSKRLEVICARSSSIEGRFQTGTNRLSPMDPFLPRPNRAVQSSEFKKVKKFLLNCLSKITNTKKNSKIDGKILLRTSLECSSTFSILIFPGFFDFCFLMFQIIVHYASFLFYLREIIFQVRRESFSLNCVIFNWKVNNGL